MQAQGESEGEREIIDLSVQTKENGQWVPRKTSRQPSSSLHAIILMNIRKRWMEEEAANAASGHYHHFGKDVRAGEMSDGENEAVQSLGK